MKQICVLVLSLGLVVTASAQKFGRAYYRPHVYYAPSVSLGLGMGGFYPGYPYYGYAPMFGYMPYRSNSRPNPLQRKVADIENEYADKIWYAKHDHSISGKQRRAEVRELKHEREQKIIEARKNAYNSNRY